jgi:nitrogen fixation/metabolism regulation signal transduction histidine kinase
VNKTNKQLLQFYQAIINQDSTVSFHESSQLQESSLTETLNSITDQLSQLRFEREVSYSYLRQVVNHLSTGIIAYKSNGKVDLVNQAALNLLGREKLENLKELKDFGEDFYRKISSPSIIGNEVVELNKNETQLKFSLQSSVFRLGDQNIQLVSLHNIKEELEINELKSWEKLIRVITHEIMNSVSPIVSLTTTLRKIYQNENKPVEPSEIGEKHIFDTLKGLQIIKRRGNGLLDFVNKIRQIHLLPHPMKEEIKVEELFEGVSRLMKGTLEKRNIHFDMKIYPKSLTLFADRSLIEQTLINMVKNSSEAFENKNDPHIELRAYDINQNTIIQIIDNGKGIDPEIQEDIFVPFYSTKSEGSGIGLSLARQIMRFHGGSISVKSSPNEQTVFTLKFNPYN